MSEFNYYLYATVYDFLQATRERSKNDKKIEMLHNLSYLVSYK